MKLKLNLISKPIRIVLFILELLIILVPVCFTLVQSGIVHKKIKINEFPQNKYSVTIKAMGPVDNEPYCYLDKENQPCGYEVELLYKIANNLGYNVSLTLDTQENIEKTFNEQKIDVLLGYELSSQKQKEKIQISNPTCTDYYTVFGKKRINNINDILNKKIGYSLQENYIIDLLNPKLLFYNSSVTTLFDLLLSNKLDYILVKKSVGLKYIRTDKYKIFIDCMQGGFSSFFYGFAFNNNEYEFKNKFNTQLNTFKSSSILDNLQRKWINNYYNRVSVKEIIYNNKTIYLSFIFVFVIWLLAVFCISWAYQLQEEKNQHQQKLLNLCDEFEIIYELNLDNNSYNYKRNQKLQLKSKDDFNAWNEYFIREGKILPELIYKDDIEMLQNTLLKNNLLKQLDSENFFTIDYRINSENGPLWYKMRITKYGNWPSEHKILIGIINNDKNYKKEQNQQRVLQEALDMANSSSRAKTTFLNNMSHDIRTPMNAIIGFTDLAKKHIDNKNEVNTYLEKINLASNYLLSLINDVLDMSRIESGKVKLSETKENLFDIVNELEIIIQNELKNKEITFDTDVTEVKNNCIVCDKLRLNQILLNIISNAIKYTSQKGDIKFTIKQLESKKRGFGSYVFSIKDSGIGMSQSFLNTIYEPFTRENSYTVSGIQGTGLGMSITKNLIDMMDGKIKIESKENVGTEVIFNIDFKIVSEHINAQKKIENTYNLNGKKILLVEDNLFNQEIACEFLQEKGIIVTTAENGLEAVEIIKKSKKNDFDIILMDIQMPVMNGYEATKTIRSLKENACHNIPIIAMTANAYEEDRIKAINAGMNDHIVKPIDIQKLQEIIWRYLK